MMDVIPLLRQTRLKDSMSVTPLLIDFSDEEENAVDSIRHGWFQIKSVKAELIWQTL
jgi:hypothetical protein